LADAEIRFGDQHIEGSERWRRRRLGRLGLSAAGRKHGSHRASGKGNTQYDEARGLHNPSTSQKRRNGGTGR
jgi:hypothetical protein